MIYLQFRRVQHEPAMNIKLKKCYTAAILWMLWHFLECCGTVGRWSQWSQGHALGPSGRNSKSLPTQNWKMRTLRWLALCVSDARSAAIWNIFKHLWDPSCAPSVSCEMVHTHHIIIYRKCQEPLGTIATNVCSFVSNWHFSQGQMATERSSRADNLCRQSQIGSWLSWKTCTICTPETGNVLISLKLGFDL